MSLTIFQKMLVAPAVAIILLGAYLLITHAEYNRASVTIQKIRDESLPVMEKASENLLLFDTIVTQFRDAVLTGEVEWLEHTKKSRDKIELNLEEMSAYNQLLPVQKVAKLQGDFKLYFDNAYALSREMLEKEESTGSRDRLIANVERYHRKVTVGMSTLKETVRQNVHDAVETTDRRLDNLHSLGALLGVVSTTAVLLLTVILSMWTRKSLYRIIGRMKNLAEGHPDFSKRLEAHNHDELGVLAGWFNVLSDKLEQDYKKIEQLSITDKLTRLYNRTKIDALFTDELKRAERAGGFSVILIDLDHFKAVNDSYGHQVGDTVLQEIARLLRSSVRGIDHVGRWGGEEFIVIAPMTDLMQAAQLAKKLCAIVDEFEFSVVGHKTASFGVSAYVPGDSVQSIMQRVDQALYVAKEQGRNRVVTDLDLAKAC